MNLLSTNRLGTGTRSILGSRFQFENLLPGNLCQSGDLFGRNKFHFLTDELQIFRNIVLLEVQNMVFSICLYHLSFKFALSFHTFFKFSNLRWQFLKFGNLSTKGLHAHAMRRLQLVAESAWQAFYRSLRLVGDRYSATQAA